MNGTAGRVSPSVSTEQPAYADHPVVVVFRERLGVRSETFIYRQAAALRRHRAHFVGLAHDGDIATDPEQTQVLGGRGLSGRLRNAALKIAGMSPAMERCLRSSRASLVHAHFGPDAAIIGPVANRLGVPLIVTFHGYDITTRDDVGGVSRTFKMYRRRRQWLQAHGARFLAVSDFLRQRAIELGFPPERTVRHYVGLNVDEFAVDPNVQRESVVLFVGRLVEVKGCRYLVEAMADVQRRKPGVRLVIIGDGPLRTDLEALAVARRVDASFLGAKPQTEVRTWMQRASVLCVPSVTTAAGAAEAFGLVFLEAAAVGTPAVSFASGGIPEAIVDGATGLLAEERDVRGLARRIEALLEDEGLRQRLTQSALARVRGSFDINRQTSLLEDIYSAAGSSRGVDQ